MDFPLQSPPAVGGLEVFGDFHLRESRGPRRATTAAATTAGAQCGRTSLALGYGGGFQRNPE